jgi:hypothetical protein
MITFAPFYKDLSKSKEIMSDGLKERVEHFDYMNAIRKLRDTFYHFNSQDHKFVVQTDEVTDTDSIDAFRTNLSEMPLMGSIVKSNTNFVHNHQGKFILVGADHLICGNVERFFDDDFDMCFFVHPKKAYVRNSVVIVNSTSDNKTGIDDFFSHREKKYHDASNEEKLWGADMYSINRALEDRGIITKYFGDKKRNSFDYDGLKVKIMDYDGKKYIKALNKDGTLGSTQDIIVIDVKGGNYRKQFFSKAYQELMERKPRK